MAQTSLGKRQAAFCSKLILETSLSPLHLSSHRWSRNEGYDKNRITEQKKRAGSLWSFLIGLEGKSSIAF